MVQSMAAGTSTTSSYANDIKEIMEHIVSNAYSTMVRTSAKWKKSEYMIINVSILRRKIELIIISIQLILISVTFINSTQQYELEHLILFLSVSFMHVYDLMRAIESVGE